MGKEDMNVFKEELLCKLSEKALVSSNIAPELYTKYEVKRGLRDADGKGVLVGLTEIGDVHSYILDEGEMVPVPGRLTYRGINIKDIVNGFMADGRFGFEEVTYLLLFGHLPDEKALNDFKKLLGIYQQLPDDFVRGVILHSPGKDIMNMLARSVLTL